MTTTTAAAGQPVLYLSHGAPPLADDRDVDRASWPPGPPTCRARRASSWSPRTGRRPRSRSRRTTPVPLVYDFWGFPQRYYDVTLRRPGRAASWPPTCAALLRRPGLPVHQDQQRGLDHGAYVPLVEMFPEADVPVLQMSMPTLDPQRLFEIGRTLAPLRDQGTLIVGSGFTTHNLALVRPERPGGRAGARALGGVRRLGPRGDAGRRRRRGAGLPAPRAGRPGGPPAHRALRAAVRRARRRLGRDARPEATSVIDGFWYGLSKRSWQIG